GTSSADRDWFVEVRGTRDVYLGMPVISRSTGRPNIPFGVPVLDADGSAAGVVVGGISTADLAETVARIRQEDAVRISVIDRRGRGAILADTESDAALQEPTGAPDLMRPLMAGEEGAVETTGTDGQPVLAAFAPVPNFPWSILIQQPTAVALAPASQRSWTELPSAAAAVCLAGAAGLFVAMKLSHPIARLRDSANRLASGDLSVRVGFRQHDEIGDLGRAFDGMAESLEERTRALEAANREM